MIIGRIRPETGLTLVQVYSGDRQDTEPWGAVLRDFGIVLDLLELGNLVVDVDHVNAEQLAGRALRYPVIRGDHCEVEGVLLLPVQRLEDGQGACRRHQSWVV